jgi:hypothetical protein
VLAPLARGDVLDHGVSLHGEVPAKVPTDAATERSPVQGLGMGVGIAGGILGAVDRDVLRRHLAEETTAILALGDQIDFQIEVFLSVAGVQGHILHGSELTFPDLPLARGRGLVRVARSKKEEGADKRHHRDEGENTFHETGKRIRKKFFNLTVPASIRKFIK